MERKISQMAMNSSVYQLLAELKNEIQCFLYIMLSDQYFKLQGTAFDLSSFATRICQSNSGME